VRWGELIVGRRLIVHPPTNDSFMKVSHDANQSCVCLKTQTPLNQADKHGGTSEDQPGPRPARNGQRVATNGVKIT